MNEKLDAKLAEIDKADFELNSVMEQLHESTSRFAEIQKRAHDNQRYE
jgi:hypothetical protein